MLNWFLNILFWSFFGISSFVLILIAAPLRLLTAPFDPNRRVLQQFSCFWASLYLWVNPFWSARIKGLERADRRKAYVMVSNHQSMVDILVVFRTFLHFKWVAKKSLFRLPILGWNMRLNGYVPIERGDPESREVCMATCRRWLARGSSVFFFPEGTRSPDGRIQAFKTGAFRLALETGAEILPIVIRGSREALPKHSLRLHGKSRMELEVLSPVSVNGFDPSRPDEESRRLADVIFGKIQGAF